MHAAVGPRAIEMPPRSQYDEVPGGHGTSSPPWAMDAPVPEPPCLRCSSQDVDWVDDMRTTRRSSSRSPTVERKEAAGTVVVVVGAGAGGNRVLVNIEVTALYIQNSQSHGKRNLSALD